MQPKPTASQRVRAVLHEHAGHAYQIQEVGMSRGFFSPQVIVYCPDESFHVPLAEVVLEKADQARSRVPLADLIELTSYTEEGE